MEPTKNVIAKAMWFANVLQHKPALHSKQLEQGYADWLKNRLKFHDLANEFSLTNLKSQPTFCYPEMDTPGILITFHFGPYRLLPRLLIAAGHQIALIASSAVLQNERSWYEHEFHASQSDSNAFSCIDASNPNSLRLILNAVLKENRSVIIFIDADEGIGEGGYCKIPLFKGYVYWRTNIFKLAERFDIPIRTVYIAVDSIGKRVNPKLVFGKKMKGKYEESLNVISTEFRQMMTYNWPAWENWSLLHKYDKSPPASKELDLAKPVWMMPCVYNGKRYFLDLYSRNFFELR